MKRFLLSVVALIAPALAAPRTADDALGGIKSILADLNKVQSNRLDRAAAASNLACALEDKIEEIEKQIDAANDAWQAEVDERNKALHAISHIQTAFGLTPEA